MHLTVRVWRQAPAMRASRQWAPVFLMLVVTVNFPFVATENRTR